MHQRKYKKLAVPVGVRRRRRMLIEAADDANERGGKFKRAGKLGQENDHSMQVPIQPDWAIFLPTIFLPNHSRPMTPRTLNGVPPSMSASSPIVGELRAFSMNGTDHRGRADE